MDYLKIYNESTPVEERDALRVARAQAEEEERLRVPNLKMKARVAKMKRESQHYIDALENFLGTSIRVSAIRTDADVFRPDDIVIELFASNYFPIIARINKDGFKLSLKGVSDVLDEQGVNCRVFLSRDDGLNISWTGKREEIGPKYGKLKKFGLDAEYSDGGKTINDQGYITHRIDLCIHSIEDIEKFNQAFGGNGFTALMNK